MSLEWTIYAREKPIVENAPSGTSFEVSPYTFVRPTFDEGAFDLDFFRRGGQRSRFRSDLPLDIAGVVEQKLHDRAVAEYAKRYDLPPERARRVIDAHR